jgi:ABC-type sugar transport system substrate-binding protein
MPGSLLRTLVLITCFTAFLTLSAEGADKSYTIAVIPKGTTHEFWKSV